MRPHHTQRPTELSLGSLLVAARLAAGGSGAVSPELNTPSLLLPGTQATLHATTASVVAAEVLAAVSRPLPAGAAAMCGGSSLAAVLQQQQQQQPQASGGGDAAMPDAAALHEASGDAAGSPPVQLPAWLREKTSPQLSASHAICRASLQSTTAALARLRSTPPGTPLAAAAAMPRACLPTAALAAGPPAAPLLLQRPLAPGAVLGVPAPGAVAAGAAGAVTGYPVPVSPAAAAAAAEPAQGFAVRVGSGGGGHTDAGSRSSSPSAQSDGAPVRCAAAAARDGRGGSDGATVDVDMCC
jgi:hypothetical protein